MTREEAIQWLTDIKENITENWSHDVAIDMAIEALSAEESVTLYATPKATYVRPLTEEIAIEFLQDSGWLPNHDKEIGNPSMLVRCKDCKHYIVEGITTQYGWCHEYKHSVNEDDYCSYGERKK